jgi:hypothetical protein
MQASIFRASVAVATVMVAAVSAGYAQSNSAEDFLRGVIRQHTLTLANAKKQLKGKSLPHLGTVLNEVGLAEFQCAGLARLFDKNTIFSRLSKVDPFPPLPWKDEATMDMVAWSFLSLTNGVRALEVALNSSLRDRVMTWNLSCVGKFEIAKAEYVPQLEPQATIEVVQDQLQVFGDIYAGFFEEFERVLDANKGIKTVVLGSGGGSVRDAILAGALIRDRRLTTTLSADCYSACPLMFLGGVDRLIWSPYPRLGFHQVSVGGKPLAADDRIYLIIASYVKDMGADAKFVVARMRQSPPTDMNHPAVGELCEPRVTTWVQRGC